jgi:hypothetical protein
MEASFWARLEHVVLVISREEGFSGDCHDVQRDGPVDL